MATVDFGRRIVPAEATRGSWGPLDSSTITGYPTGDSEGAARGKYAQLTYIMGSEPGSLSLALSGGNVILPVSSVNINEPLSVTNTVGQDFEVLTTNSWATGTTVPVNIPGGISLSLSSIDVVGTITNPVSVTNTVGQDFEVLTTNSWATGTTVPVNIPGGISLSLSSIDVVGTITNPVSTVLMDAANNPIASILDTVDSQYHLAVSMIQDVKIDANNSSTTNLVSGNSHTFTGSGTTTLGVVGLQWNLATDQDATVYVEQSDDNINWDISDTFDYTASATNVGNTVQAVTSYWRIRVILVGTADTTYFRLAGVLCPIANPLPRALSETGRLKVQNEDQAIEIPRGRIKGYSAVNKFGANSNVDSGATEEIWDGNRVYIWPTTASITHLRTAADTPAMDGMVVEIQGLDNDYNLVVQNATIDAATSTTTEVLLGTALRRVFRIKVLSSVVTTDPIWVGPTGMSAATASGIVQVGNNQTLMAIYCVPAGKTAYMTMWKATVNPATGRDPTSMPIRMWARDNANGYAPQLKDDQGLIVGNLRVPYNPYYKFNEKTDIYFTASPVDKPASVSIGFDLILIDN